MGAAASIADAFSAKEIYLLSFKHSLTISELEFLYRQYTTLTTASPPSLQSQTDTHNSVLQHRICTFFFPPKNTPGSSAMMSTGDGGSVGGRTLVDCSFDVFCGKVNDWRKSSVSDRVNVLYKILDVSGEGELTVSDLVHLLAGTSGVKVGERVRLSNEARAGVLRWRGPLKGLEGDWAGIELDQPLGKNNGSYNGKPLFKCKDLHGVFKPIGMIESEKSYAIAKRSIERFLGSEPTAEPVITLDVFKAKIAKETWLIDLLHKDPLPEELRAVPSV